MHDIRWDAAGRLTDTPYWANLSAYLGRGSKLMYFHGVSDPWFSAFDSFDSFDMLDPLVDWVESDEAPAAVTALQGNDTPLSMPLCPWPDYAHYTGGPQLVESSYECRMPES